MLNFLSNSIKNKLILGIALLHAVLMTVFVYDLVNRQQSFLMDESYTTTTGIAKNLAVNSIPWVLSNDVAGLNEIIQAQTEQPNFRFAMIVDERGQVIAYHHHNQNAPDLVGKFIETAPLKKAIDSNQTVAIYHNHKAQLDIAVPIRVQDTIIGWARVDMSRRHMYDTIRHLSIEGTLYTLFAILIGALIAWFMGRNLTKGIYKLISATQRVRAGERDFHITLNRSDELQTLSENFQSMLESLSRKENELSAEKERLQITLHSIGDGVITTDKHGLITYLNPVSELLTGWQNSAAQGVHIDQVFKIYHEKTMEPSENPALKSMKYRKKTDLASHTVLVNKAGEKISIEDSGAPIVDPSGTVIGSVLVFHDSTEARLLRKRLTWQALHDSLTGLKNRQAFENKFDQIIKTSAENPLLQNALIYIDLDQFKIVNDTVGHTAGDELLKQVATVLKNQVRDTDLLARTGGDEFAILLEDCSVEDAQVIAEKIRSTIYQYRFIWHERIFDIGASIGVTQIQGDVNKADIMSQADVACYIAKQNGRNRVHVYKADDIVLSQEFAKLDWANRIKRALESEQFVLYAQKIVPLQSPSNTKEKIIYEVLVRLKLADKIISPDQFLPAAERFNLMGELDIYIIKKAIKWLNLNADKIDLLNINISGQSLDDDYFNQALLEILKQNSATNHKICFEITESAAISHMSSSIDFLHHIRNYGCQLALDDFGSGFASFGWLKNLPVDYVKIDGNFILDILDDPVDAVMVKAIHQVSDQMGIETIAEFVENQAVTDWLKVTGIDYAQGYHFNAPTPLEEITLTPP